MDVVPPAVTDPTTSDAPPPPPPPPPLLVVDNTAVGNTTVTHHHRPASVQDGAGMDDRARAGSEWRPDSAAPPTPHEVEPTTTAMMSCDACVATQKRLDAVRASNNKLKSRVVETSQLLGLYSRNQQELKQSQSQTILLRDHLALTTFQLAQSQEEVIGLQIQLERVIQSNLPLKQTIAAKDAEIAQLKHDVEVRNNKLVASRFHLDQLKRDILEIEAFRSDRDKHEEVAKNMRQQLSQRARQIRSLQQDLELRTQDYRLLREAAESFNPDTMVRFNVPQAQADWDDLEMDLGSTSHSSGRHFQRAASPPVVWVQDSMARRLVQQVTEGRPPPLDLVRREKQQALDAQRVHFEAALHSAADTGLPEPVRRPRKPRMPSLLPRKPRKKSPRATSTPSASRKVSKPATPSSSKGTTADIEAEDAADTGSQSDHTDSGGDDDETSDEEFDLLDSDFARPSDDADASEFVTVEDDPSRVRIASPLFSLASISFEEPSVTAASPSTASTSVGGRGARSRVSSSNGRSGRAKDSRHSAATAEALNSARPPRSRPRAAAAAAARRGAEEATPVAAAASISDDDAADAVLPRFEFASAPAAPSATTSHAVSTRRPVISERRTRLSSGSSVSSIEAAVLPTLSSPKRSGATRPLRVDSQRSSRVRSESSSSSSSSSSSASSSSSSSSQSSSSSDSSSASASSASESELPQVLSAAPEVPASTSTQSARRARAEKVRARRHVVLSEDEDESDVTVPARSRSSANANASARNSGSRATSGGSNSSTNSEAESDASSPSNVFRSVGRQLRSAGAALNVRIDSTLSDEEADIDAARSRQALLGHASPQGQHEQRSSAGLRGSVRLRLNSESSDEGTGAASEFDELASGDSASEDSSSDASSPERASRSALMDQSDPVYQRAVALAAQLQAERAGTSSSSSRAQASTRTRSRETRPAAAAAAAAVAPPQRPKIVSSEFIDSSDDSSNEYNGPSTSSSSRQSRAVSSSAALPKTTTSRTSAAATSSSSTPRAKPTGRSKAAATASSSSEPAASSAWYDEFGHQMRALSPSVSPLGFDRMSPTPAQEEVAQPTSRRRAGQTTAQQNAANLTVDETVAWTQDFHSQLRALSPPVSPLGVDMMQSPVSPVRSRRSRAAAVLSDDSEAEELAPSSPIAKHPKRVRLDASKIGARDKSTPAGAYMIRTFSLVLSGSAPMSELLQAWQSAQSFSDSSLFMNGLQSLCAHCTTYWGSQLLREAEGEALSLLKDQLLYAIVQTFEVQGWDVLKPLMNLHIRIINEQHSAPMMELVLVCRLFTGLCRAIGHLRRARVLFYDLLSKDSSFRISLVHAVATVWPSVVLCESYNGLDRPLVTDMDAIMAAFEVALKMRASQSIGLQTGDDSQIARAQFKEICELAHWDATLPAAADELAVMDALVSPIITAMTELLLSGTVAIEPEGHALLDDATFTIVKALALLAHTHLRVLDLVLQGHIWPAFQEWLRGHLNPDPESENAVPEHSRTPARKLSDASVVGLVTLLGLMHKISIQSNPVASTGDFIRQKLVGFLRAPDPVVTVQMKAAAAETLEDCLPLLWSAVSTDPFMLVPNQGEAIDPVRDHPAITIVSAIGEWYATLSKRALQRLPVRLAQRMRLCAVSAKPSRS
ncbi:hypothetical protein CAOG_02117 [Capsaspora owczarzaki ATCC 30864]|uniref:Uncharacterized protein n=1 Tax=Capsaspora owczarzaki (strain ATCC 30864) TaxID=595528 RepID=A0A0D2X1I7_CAPO3|nr:hypothetical protein CAOG_02117 [Capsaspora owczarzaki ATCC 30864]KJE90879.1 hypothetical protein CAOG_002117 [Capsaspora owczarzaki ATCC 30864]|eukprot:XP_004348867.2 hypothetical protein CAOG_02117 [Capsaspora owczarzaki ATCC 30864]